MKSFIKTILMIIKSILQHMYKIMPLYFFVVLYGMFKSDIDDFLVKKVLPYVCPMFVKQDKFSISSLILITSHFIIARLSFLFFSFLWSILKGIIPKEDKIKKDNLKKTVSIEPSDIQTPWPYKKEQRLGLCLDISDIWWKLSNTEKKQWRAECEEAKTINNKLKVASSATERSILFSEYTHSLDKIRKRHDILAKKYLN